MSSLPWKPAALLLAILIIWQMACDMFGVPEFLLPSPTSIALKLWEFRDRYAMHAGVTLYEIFAGFGLAVTIGILLAAAIVHSRLLAESLFPLLVITQVTPQVAVAPILVIWFGSGDLPKILVAFFVAFFPMVVNTATGLIRVDQELVNFMKGLGASRWAIFWRLRMPNAAPYIFAGMRISITLAVIGAVVGEFVAAHQGLGYLVFTGTANLDTRLTFGAIVLLACIGIVLFKTVDLAKRIFVPWADDRQEGGT